MGIRKGQILARRYEIQMRLGRGGNSQVYLANDTVSGRKRAVKQIKKSGNSRMCGFARKEAETVQKLNYPYFPEIVDILQTDEADYIVMEYLQGETAGERLCRLGPQPAQEVMRWAKDLCLMLSYLHSQKPSMVYCDMKPDNIMIQPEGNLRLIDFGAVLELKQEDARPQLLLGTRGYAAPEQLGNGHPVDARADIYGLGVTMYQLLTAQDPCKAEAGAFPARSLRRAMPRRLERIVRKCTREEPEMRYQTCDELREDLAKAET